jgi:hypothetical protein
MTREQTAVVLLGVCGLVLVWAWTAGARTGRRAERATRTVTRMGSTTGRTLICAAVIVGVQWAVITWTTHPGVIATVLGVPALIAGGAVARLLTVEQSAHLQRRGGGRR